VGAASPVDYLIDSILQPNKALKDGYDSILVATNDSDVIQGIKVREDAKELVLRDNLRDEIVIATSNIKSRKPGGSLMPQGLADGLTHGEFLDLVRFLSELGKPGTYAVPSDGVVRRWRVLDPVPAGLAISADAAPPAGDAGWWPAYTLVTGVLPPDALANSGKGVAFARCQVDATSPGKVRLLLNSPKGLRLWADDRAVDVTGPEVTLDLPRGVRTLTFRIDPSSRGNEGLRAELADAPGSPGHVQPVGGK
jgi:putative heme-binding domain-containing protein